MDQIGKSQVAPEADRLHQLAQTVEVSDLAQAASVLSAADIAELVSILSQQTSNTEKKNLVFLKIHALMTALDDATKLQALGQTLNPVFASYLLEIAAKGEEGLQKRLAPLLVGIQPAVFSEILSLATPAQLALLKQQAPTEPLQHQLYLLAQNLTDTLNLNQKEFDTLQRDIEELPLSDIDVSYLRTTIEAIENLRNSLQAPQKIIHTALILVWNTARADLIDTFSHLKELYLKYISHFIGMPADDSVPSTGLYKTLKERLEGVYGENADNSQASIDALANLSIWYLQDYWEIGLLPHVASLEQLLDGETESERATQRGALFGIAKNNLEKLGLVTLKDLKNAHIYSRKDLQSYIKEHSKD